MEPQVPRIIIFILSLFIMGDLSVILLHCVKFVTEIHRDYNRIIFHEVIDRNKFV